MKSFEVMRVNGHYPGDWVAVIYANVDWTSINDFDRDGGPWFPPLHAVCKSSNSSMIGVEILDGDCEHQLSGLGLGASHVTIDYSTNVAWKRHRF